MKTFIIALIVLLASTVYSATLKWDATTDADGYIVEFADGVGTFTHTTTDTQVLDIEHTLNLHPATTYTFGVKAYNQMGESGLSNTC